MLSIMFNIFSEIMPSQNLKRGLPCAFVQFGDRMTPGDIFYIVIYVNGDPGSFAEHNL